ISAFVGTILGLRFKVMILIPAIGIDSIAILGAAFAQGDNRWSTFVVVLSAGTALQIGYLAGTVISFAAAKSSAPTSENIVAAVQKRFSDNLVRLRRNMN